MSDSFGERITAATPILTMGLGLFALFAGFDWWWMVFVFGWVVLTPLVAILFGDDDEAGVQEPMDPIGTGDRDRERERRTATADQSGSTSKQDALETLRDRYARGELSDDQFEAKLERLLETDSLENAREFAQGRSADLGEGDEFDYDPTGGADPFDDLRSGSGDREREREKERERE